MIVRHLVDMALSVWLAVMIYGATSEAQTRSGSLTVVLKRGEPVEQTKPTASRNHQRPQSQQRAQKEMSTPSLYYGRLLVGVPPQEFKVAFDTGSGNIIIPSQGCADEGCKGHRRYDPRLSNSSKQVRVPNHSSLSAWHKRRRKYNTSSMNNLLGRVAELAAERSDDVDISFGEGLISGSYMHDRVCLGEDGGCLQANFIAANFESQMPFGTVAYDGILGLSLSQLAEGEEYSIVECMLKTKLLHHSLFSIFFGYDGEGSEATFGEYQQGKMASDIFWAPVVTSGFWQVEVDDIMVGSEHLHVCKSRSKCQAIVDTGTSCITGPDVVVTAILNEVDLKADCSNVKTLPDISLVLGNRVLSLKPEDYVLQTRFGCTMALMPLDIPPPKGPLTILGEPLLRRYYTVYDREHMRVGFALAKHAVHRPPLQAVPHRPLFPKLNKLLQSWGHVQQYRRRLRHVSLAKLKQLVRPHGSV